MKRVLVADDERPLVETILRIVRRDLSSEFEIVGTASSGREAIERADSLSPDIVLMDVRMPGLSGLDAVRELRRRGSEAVFILVTAYERFDIAREAVELGVQDYLLKPVSKEALAQSLRSASALIERRDEFERREVEYREREERMRIFVETAFLHALALGESLGPQLQSYRQALSLEEPLALAAAASFSAVDDDAGSVEPGALHERFREILRYKTRALAGPLVGGLCALVVPLKLEDEVEAALQALREAADAACGEGRGGHGRGGIGLSFGPVRLFPELGESWAAALRGLWAGPGRTASVAVPSAVSVAASVAVSGARHGDAWPPEGRPGDAEEPGEGKEEDKEEAFLSALVEGSAERSRFAFERALADLDGSTPPASWRRFRLVSLLGSAYRALARRGLLDPAEAELEFDMAELLAAPDLGSFLLVARTRCGRIVDRLARIPRRSAAVSGAIAFITRNFGGQVSLELAADAVGLSPNRLSRLFVEETGRGFSDYLIQYRIDRAKEMLLAPGASIKQVSAACGYPDPNYFSRLFKKVTGLTPTSFSSGITEANDAEL